MIRKNSITLEADAMNPTAKPNSEPIFTRNFELAEAVGDLLGPYADKLNERDYERVSRLRGVRAFAEGERNLIVGLIKRFK
jgi:hypothetical protein